MYLILSYAILAVLVAVIYITSNMGFSAVYGWWWFVPLFIGASALNLFFGIRKDRKAKEKLAEKKE